jgi:hypothetical protein
MGEKIPLQDNFRRTPYIMVDLKRNNIIEGWTNLSTTAVSASMPLDYVGG